MKSRFLVLSCVLLGVMAAAGCRRTASEPPVGTVALTLNHAKLPLGSPVELTYEFKVAADAPKFNQDYRVFVHFKDADDELMWTDDHNPPTPTSQWKPGETIKYSRLLFIPVYPYVGQASIDMGLYGKDGKRVPLQATEKGQLSYRVAKIEILPQTENIYLTYKDGWNPAEMAPDNASNEWHWTKKDASVSFKNPKRNVVFYLDVDGQSKLFTEPQNVTVRIGEQVLATFPIPARQEVRRIPISAAQLGSEDKVEVSIGVDRTFVPAVVTSGAQRDPRELGVRVFHAFVEQQ